MRQFQGQFCDNFRDNFETISGTILRQFQGQFCVNYFVLTDKAFFQLMEFDAPEHENNTGHDSKNKGVSEMPVQRQFDEISAEA